MRQSSLTKYFTTSKITENFDQFFSMIHPWVNHAKGTIHLLQKGDILTCYEQQNGPLIIP